MQTGLRKNFSSLVDKAHVDIDDDTWEFADLDKHKSLASFMKSLSLKSWSDLPKILKVLRKRAAAHMNRVMVELRKGRTKEVKACAVVDLLAQVAAASPEGFSSKAKRLSHMRELLLILCYQRGYRGSLKHDPYSGALNKLVTAGVLEFDPLRRFYLLADAYVRAADTLANLTGDPFLSVFGTDFESYKIQRDGSMPANLREG